MSFVAVIASLSFLLLFHCIRYVAVDIYDDHFHIDFCWLINLCARFVTISSWYSSTLIVDCFAAVERIKKERESERVMVKSAFDLKLFSFQSVSITVSKASLNAFFVWEMFACEWKSEKKKCAREREHRFDGVIAQS